MSVTRIIARSSLLRTRPTTMSFNRFQSSTSGSLIKESTNLPEFRTLIKSENLTVTDFYATWCGPCKAISPVLEKLSQEYKDQVQFLKVDVDSATDIAQEYGVSAMPTFIFFKDGEPLGKVVGANPAGIKKAIDQLK